MAIRLNKTGDHIQQGTVEYTADAASDIVALPTGVTPGSECFCIEESKTYILNNNGEWKEKKQGSGGGSGGGGGSSYPSADGRSFPLYNDDVTLLTQSQYYNDIAKAINEKLEEDDKYTPAQMATAIENIPSGGMTLTEWFKLSTRRRLNLADDSNAFSRFFTRNETLETYDWNRATNNGQGDWYISYELLSRGGTLNIYMRPDSNSGLTIETGGSNVKNWTTWNGSTGNYSYNQYPRNFYLASESSTQTYGQFLNLSDSSHPWLKNNFIDDDTTVNLYNFYTSAKFKDFFNIIPPQSTQDGIIIYYSSYYSKFFILISINEADRPTIENNGRIYVNPPLGVGEVTKDYYNIRPDINVEILQQSWGYLDNASYIIFNTFDIKRTGSDEVVLAANCTKADLI